MKSRRLRHPVPRGTDAFETMRGRMSHTDKRTLRHDLLEELAGHGPSRGIDVAAAFMDLDGWDFGVVLDALSELGDEKLASVEQVDGHGVWSITELGRKELLRKESD